MPHLLRWLFLEQTRKKYSGGYVDTSYLCSFIGPQHFQASTGYHKPILEELWNSGHQTLLYAEGNWDFHLSTFRELPAGVLSSMWIGAIYLKPIGFGGINSV